MENAGGGPAQVVRAHMAKAGLFRAFPDDLRDARRRLEGSAPRKLTYAESSLLPAHQGIAPVERTAGGGFVPVEIVRHERQEGGADGDLPGSALLADPLQHRLAIHEEAGDGDVLDLEHPHPGQPETEDQLIPSPHIGVIADTQESPERFFVGEPAGRILPLELSVDRRRRTHRVLPALQILDQGRIRLSMTDAPPQKGARPSHSTSTGVVGPSLTDPLIHHRLAEAPWMGDPGEREQSRQLRLVLLGGLRIGIPSDEPLDEVVRR